MSVDDRIRAGMRANAAAHQPAVESSLDKVRNRARRGQATRVLVAVWAVAAVSATVTVVAWPHGPDRSGSSTREPSTTSALFGSYESEVTSPAPLAGHWILEVRGNGTVTVTPPPGYAGVVSGSLLSADRSTLRTNLFQQDVCADLGNGEFRWTRDGSRLDLRAVDDLCAPRRTFFGGNRWVAIPGS